MCSEETARPGQLPAHSPPVWSQLVAADVMLERSHWRPHLDGASSDKALGSIALESAASLSQLGEAVRGIKVAATQELLMEPTVAAGQYDLRGLRVDLLRSAAEIYLRLAYPSGKSARRRGTPHELARRLSGRRPLERAALRTRGQGPRPAVSHLRAAARQPPLPAHEASDRGVAQRGRLPALGQHP